MLRDINRSRLKSIAIANATFVVNQTTAKAGKPTTASSSLRQPRVITAFKENGVLAATIYVGALALSVLLPSSTESAIANGDTRTLSLYHSHSGESIDATFRVNGAYDPAVLAKLNHFLRDWRNNDETKMDPRLFDVVWEVYRSAGANEPVVVVSAYRSPETNAMLRRRSHAVAEHSQHILGKAMDTTMPGMSMERVREIGMRLQRGGVGYYGSSNFVHLDVGSVRYWPRMSYDQLARVFPDGKSVLMASNGRTLPRYEEARAEIASRGGVAADAPTSGGGNFFAWLFGNHNRDQDEDAEVVRSAGSRRDRTRLAAIGVAGGERAGTTDAQNSVAADRRDSQPAPVAAAIAAPASDQSAAAGKTIVASLGPAPDVRDRRAAAEDNDLAANVGVKDKTEKNLAFKAPLPPSRPVELVAVANVPIPPAKPEALTRVASLTTRDRVDASARSSGAKTDAVGGASASDAGAAPLARAASLPVVITQGPKDQARVPAQVLAYAGGAQQSPGFHGSAASGKDAGESSRAAVAAARLDHSNLESLTGDAASASAPTPSVLGQALTGLRRAARIIPDALSGLPTATGLASAFKAVASELDSAHFSGAPANKAAEASVNIAETSTPRGN